MPEKLTLLYMIANDYIYSSCECYWLVKTQFYKSNSLASARPILNWSNSVKLAS